MLYIAASGAKQDLLGTAVRANNLANAQTTGFKAQLEQARAMPAYGEGLPTRVFAMTESPTNNYESGPLQTTGRDLDMAIQGDGFFAVQDQNGAEAYTRAGSLQINANGMLQDAKGNLVMGDNGPINIPGAFNNISIASDGMVMTRPQGAPETELAEVGRIKLVKPEYSDVKRGEDGLFRMKNAELADADATVIVAGGMLEGSNVNAVDEMVNMISLQRHYEMQVKLMKKADTLSTRANQLLRIL